MTREEIAEIRESLDEVGKPWSSRGGTEQVRLQSDIAELHAALLRLLDVLETLCEETQHNPRSPA